MAQPTDSPTSLSHAEYLFDVFAAMLDFKGDWHALALKHGVHIRTASRRIETIAKRNGYKFENGRVTQVGENAVAGDQSTETPKKARNKRAPKTTPALEEKEAFRGHGEG